MPLFLICFRLLLLLLLISLIHALPTKSQRKQHKIVKRFVLHNQRWQRCRLSWAFRDPFGLFPTDERFGQAKRVIAEAMHHWERAGRNLLRFTDLSPASRSSLLNSRRVADIDIFFAGFAHGDAEAFDGRGGLVAHSAYPPLGIVHFDASELWVLQGKRKRKMEKDNVAGDQQQQPFLDLRYVALHEIGHALGLRHSTFRNSVMNRYYKEQLSENLAHNNSGEKVAIKLSKDDHAAIQELFGEKCRSH